jgi:hypothetical protein
MCSIFDDFVTAITGILTHLVRVETAEGLPSKVKLMKKLLLRMSKNLNV